MKSRITLLLSFVAAFLFAIPSSAAFEEAAPAPAADSKEPEAKAPEAKVEEKAPEAKVEEKAPEAKASEAKTEAKPAEITTDEGAVDSVKQMVAAGKQGKWSVVVGLCIMFLVFVLRRLNVLSKVPSTAVPWVAAGLSILGYISAAIMVDGVDLVDALAGGFTSGASAVGLWEMIFKNISAFQTKAS